MAPLQHRGGSVLAQAALDSSPMPFASWEGGVGLGEGAREVISPLPAFVSSSEKWE